MRIVNHISNLVLITILLYLCTSTFYKITKSIFDKHLSFPVYQAHSKTQIPNTLKPLETYKPIIDRNLFNTKKQSDHTNNLPDTEHLPETNLRLKLWGTVVGGPVEAYAVIEEVESKVQNLYREGDKIQQATVKRILRGMVILRINGRDEILEMEDSLKHTLSDSTETRQNNDELSGDEQQISVDRVLIDDAIIGRKFLTFAKIRPHFGGPDAMGLKITEINPDSLFAQMGIKDGDILTSVDGKQFRKTKEAIDYYKSLPPSAGMNLELIRNGNKMTIHYDFK